MNENFTFDVYVDSGCNLPDELTEKHNITVIPYSYIIDGEEHLCYEKGKSFKEVAKSFYELLRNGADIKTSLISEARFCEYVTPSLENGKDVVILTMSAGISGTNAQAVKAKEQLSAKYPDRKIVVIDTANGSMGSGLVALGVAKLREEGKSLEEIKARTEENVYRVNSFVTVNDLKYLKRGGRVSAVVALAGALLNIKPVLWADDKAPANLVVCGKERGRKKSVAAIMKAFEERVENPESQTVAITHADCDEEAGELAEFVKSKGVRDVIVEYYDLCTGAHAGPGTLALFFTGKDRRSK